MTELSLPTVLDTERLGAALASHALSQEAPPQALYLHGELGSGKTTLARGLLRELGITGTVRSPTYTLLESYETTGHQVLHLDLYRLAEAAELDGLGLRDEWVPGALLLIEWPERADSRLPPPDLRVTLKIEGEGRKAQLTPESETGRAWLTAALTAWSQNSREFKALAP